MWRMYSKLHLWTTLLWMGFILALMKLIDKYKMLYIWEAIYLSFFRGGGGELMPLSINDNIDSLQNWTTQVHREKSVVKPTIITKTVTLFLCNCHFPLDINNFIDHHFPSHQPQPHCRKPGSHSDNKSTVCVSKTNMPCCLSAESKIKASFHEKRMHIDISNDQAEIVTQMTDWEARIVLDLFCRCYSLYEESER